MKVIHMNKLTSAVALMLPLFVIGNLDASAGTIDFDVQVLAGLDPDTFDPLPVPPLDENFVGDPILLQLGLNFTPTPGVGERDFLNFAANLNVSGGLIDPGFGYQPSASPEVDTSPLPGFQGGPVFPTNTDSAASDLQGIILSKTAPLSDTDNRTTFSGYPVEFGQVFLLWDGTEGSLSIDGSASFNVPGGDTQPESLPFESFEFSVGGDSVVATGDPAAGDISSLLQTAFDSRLGGPAIVPIMIMDGTVTGFLFENVAPEFVDFLNFVDDPSTDEEGRFLLTLNGPFEDLDPGTIISGDLTVFTDNGEVGYGFSVNVPEPSAVVTSALALVGLGGVFRRRIS